MNSVVIRVALAAVFGIAASAASAQTLNTIKSRGVLNCGSNGTLAGFGLPDSQGRWTGLDVDLCKALAAAIFNDPEQGQVRAADREGPLHRAAIGRGRRARPQHHLDLVARHLARPQLHGGQLLRRPGLHGAQGAEGELGARAQRRRGLRAAGHHHRAEPRRLLPRQQDEAQDRHLRHRRRGDQGLRRRPLRRLHHRRLGPRRRAAAARQRQRPHHPAGGHLQGAARRRRSATATTSGSTS